MLSTVLQFILGIGFLFFGFMKFYSQDMVSEFERYGFSSGFRKFTGFVEVVGAIVIVWGVWYESLSAIGAFVLGVTMLGAIYTHLVRAKDSFSKAVVPIILLALAVVVFVLNFDSIPFL
ncbi:MULTISPECIES: DoxX family protein [Priestia]|uniref:DoxX family protein n=1 Tax=Priestia veravalensis TaxID=1414648 RepID=A0A0V8JGV7_9BACI|nr:MULTISPECIES: DoxX family protein [Priestia]KSU86277.1 hypothetical protein AS180_19515 [Priestia veravalensis]SCC54984.1 DoxX-like family protein [Priestia flexa]